MAPSPSFDSKKFSARDTVSHTEAAHSKAMDLAAHVVNFDDKVAMLAEKNKLLKGKLAAHQLDTAEVMRELEYTRFACFYKWRDIVAAEYRRKRLQAKKQAFQEDGDRLRLDKLDRETVLREAERKKAEMEQEKATLQEECSAVRSQLEQLILEEKQLELQLASNEDWLDIMRTNATEKAQLRTRLSSSQQSKHEPGCSVLHSKSSTPPLTPTGRHSNVSVSSLVREFGIPPSSSTSTCNPAGPGQLTLQQAARVKAGLLKSLAQLDEFNKKRHKDAAAALGGPAHHAWSSSMRLQTQSGKELSPITPEVVLGEDISDLHRQARGDNTEEVVNLNSVTVNPPPPIKGLNSSASSYYTTTPKNAMPPTRLLSTSSSSASVGIPAPASVTLPRPTGAHSSSTFNLHSRIVSGTSAAVVGRGVLTSTGTSSAAPCQTATRTPNRNHYVGGQQHNNLAAATLSAVASTGTSATVSRSTLRKPTGLRSRAGTASTTSLLSTPLLRDRGSTGGAFSAQGAAADVVGNNLGAEGADQQRGPRISGSGKNVKSSYCFKTPVPAMGPL